jgi:hypothetical protein
MSARGASMHGRIRSAHYRGVLPYGSIETIFLVQDRIPERRGSTAVKCAERGRRGKKPVLGARPRWKVKHRLTLL